MKIFVSLLFLLSGTVSATAQYFGEFLDELTVTWNVTNEDGWNTITLLNDFRFQDPNTLMWSTPSGYTVNGASIPRWAWSVVGSPYTGRYLPASVIHDHFVHIKSRTAHDTHRNFYYGMLANGVPWYKAKAMHWAVAVYTDWDIDTPNTENRLLPKTPEAERQLSNALRSVEARFAAESLALGAGALPSPQYETDQVELDALSFRKVLNGDLPMRAYEGIAIEENDPLVLDLLDQGPSGFEIRQGNAAEFQRAFPSTSPFEEASFGLPSGIEFSINLPEGVAPASMSNDFDALSKGNFLVVNEGMFSNWTASSIGAAVDDVMVKGMQDLISSSPHNQVGVYFHGSANADAAFASSGLDTYFKQGEGAVARVLTDDEINTGTPLVPFASFRKHGTVVSGDYNADGSFQMNGKIPMSVYSGFD